MFERNGHHKGSKGDAQYVSYSKGHVIHGGSEPAMLLGHHADHGCGIRRIEEPVGDRAQDDHSAGTNQSESVRSSPPTLRDATMMAAPSVAGVRGPKRSDIYPLRGAKATVRIDGAMKSNPTAVGDK